MTPFEELKKRLTKLKAEMKKADFAAALIIQRADLFYFSGTGQSAHLFIPVNGEPSLIVRKSLTRAREESSLENVIPFTGWDKLLELINSEIPAGSRIGVEADVLPANLYFRYKKLLNGFQLADISMLIRQIRSVKSPHEIELMKKAADISRSVLEHAKAVIRKGMTEIELASLLEQHARKLGHQGSVRMRGFNQELYYGHIMTGGNASAVTFFDGPTGGSGLNPSFPQGAGISIISNNEPILVDFVSVYGGYMVDQTRIFSLGSPSPHLVEAYNQALKIKHRLIEMGKPGTAASLLYDKADELAAQAGLANHFMGYVEKVNFVGHGVGLELDELPVIARGVDHLLEEGMVFALEPKFIFPGEGTVGIEDTFVVGCSKLEQLTDYSDQLEIL
jgi:Xaa-Pro dipeptidase